MHKAFDLYSLKKHYDLVNLTFNAFTGEPMLSRLLLLFSAIILGVLISGCGGGGSSGDPAPTPTPTPALTYTVGGAINGLTSGSLILQNNGGDSLSISANSSTFTFTTPLANGASYSISIASQTTPKSCTISNSVGTVSGSNINSTQVNCFSQYLYLGLFPGIGSTNLLGYSVDGSTGLLTATPIPSYVIGLGGGFSVSSMVASTNSNYLYAMDDAENLNIMAINPANGNLSAVSSIGSVGPFGVTMTPLSNFLYSSNYSGSVSAYGVNSNTGALTSVAGSPYAATNAIQQIGVDASGKFVYAMNLGFPSTVYSYSLNQLTGALTPIAGSPFAAGGGAYQLVVNPKYEYLYVMNQGDSNISGFNINSTTGVLTSLTGSPFSAGSGVFGGAFTPDGKYLYVTNRSDNTISAYSVSPTTGALTQLTGSPFAASNGVFQISVDAAGKYVYAVGYSVDIYSINPSSGFLTSVLGNGQTPTGAFIQTVVTNNH